MPKTLKIVLTALGLSATLIGAAVLTASKAPTPKCIGCPPDPGCPPCRVAR